MSYQYTVYGLAVDSDIPLALPRFGDASLGRVRLAVASEAYFETEVGAARHSSQWDGWFQHVPVGDGRSYVRGWDMGEFLVSADGTLVVCGPISNVAWESFQVYLLGQALSYALVKQGFEPLHATAVVLDGRAIALLGPSGRGKSTLAAGFVECGFRVLTDDLLMFCDGRGGTLAFPGPGRLKLFPRIASRIAATLAGTVAMNPTTQKLIVPLDDAKVWKAPARLEAIYEIEPPRGAPGPQDVSIAKITPRAATAALIRGTFNQRLLNAHRLARQLEIYAGLARSVPVKRLSYPRSVSRLPEVVHSVLDDIAPRGEALPPVAVGTATPK